MKLLLDTHLIVWAAGRPDLLSARAKAMICDVRNELFFSVASIWEIAIKRAKGREAQLPDPRVLRRKLLENSYQELTILSDHVVSLDGLPAIHNDPFDRILIAQARVEAMTFITADRVVAGYPGSILLVAGA